VGQKSVFVRGDTSRVNDCPFCQRIASGRELSSTTALSAALIDIYPVSEDHTLVVPRRHVARVEDLEDDEWSDLFGLVRDITRKVAAGDGVDGVNVGFNSGAAAGQTVDHAHIHVIPRVFGDVDDPRGGVRWVLPESADYWSQK